MSKTMRMRYLLLFTAVVLAVVALGGVQRVKPKDAGTSGRSLSSRGNNVTNVVRSSCDFSKFRHKAWVTGNGRVKRVLEDDTFPPCHQRFILEDDYGNTLLVAHNIDLCDRVQGLWIGDTIAFRGEFIRAQQGRLVHWTHPDPSHRRQGGWLKKIASAKATFADETDTTQSDEDVSETSPTPEEVSKASATLPPEIERTEYFAGRGPIATRVAAPVNAVWPDTGYWLSTNSGARHNRRCENYRKTRGYPCKKNEGRPCGKCGG